MKRTLSLLLSLIMLLSITTGLGLSAYADTSGDYEYDLFDNCTVEITQYIGNDKEVSIPSMIDGYIVTSIGSYAFDGCESLTNVTIGNNVTSIRHEAFWNCHNLMSVILPYSIITIGDSAFEFCSSLTDIYYNSTMNDWYEISIGDYNECFRTATIHCTDGVIQNSPSGDYEYDFLDDNYIQITKYNGDDSDVVIPETIDNYIVKEIGEHAFCELTEEGGNGYDFITSVYIPDTVDTIYNGAFGNCENLKSVRLSANLKYLYNWVFQECISLTNIVLPEKLEYIGMTCFSDCKNLTSINIPKSVTHIGSWAFQDCVNLSDVYYGSSKEDWNKFLTGEYLMGDCNECLLNATIHCTDGVINRSEQPSTPTEPANPSVPTQPNKPEVPTTAPPTQPTAPVVATPTQPAVTAPITKEKAPSGAKKVNGEWIAKKQKNAKIKKLTKGKKSFKIKWSKVSGVKGYQIQYSTSKKFTKKTTKSVTIKKNKTTSKTVKKLKAKKKYYVRIRTYKTVNGQKVYSTWSKAKSVTTKK